MTDLAIKCATHSRSNDGGSFSGSSVPEADTYEVSPFPRPESPPREVRLCVAGFMMGFVQAVGGTGFIADSSLTGNLGRDRVREESRGGRYAGDPRIQNQALDRGLP
jgi:hypothetical protein